MKARPTQVSLDGRERTVEREWIDEAPVALEFNGLSYAVMMATPADMEDFARGFAMTEGLAQTPSDISEIVVARVELGVIVRAQLTGVGIAQLTERVRTRVAESSCGLCGIENLESVAKPLPRVADHVAIESTAIFRATGALYEHQSLGQQTSAAHAAAFCDSAGKIIAVREDVGRHNAVDKLVGALAASGAEPEDGFFISTARCSYEIVEKVVRAGGTTLVTVSLPTSMAVERASACGLSLICLARGDSFLKIDGISSAQASHRDT